MRTVAMQFRCRTCQVGRMCEWQLWWTCWKRRLQWPVALSLDQVWKELTLQNVWLKSALGSCSDQRTLQNRGEIVFSAAGWNNAPLSPRLLEWEVRNRFSFRGKLRSMNITWLKSISRERQGKNLNNGMLKKNLHFILRRRPADRC